MRIHILIAAVGALLLLAGCPDQFDDEVPG